MTTEIDKEKFRSLYFQFGVSDATSGWTVDYWDTFFENEQDARYFFTTPDSPGQTRMFIDSGGGTHRLYLLTEEAEESFFH